MCRQAIQRQVDYNLHFFVNSVRFIAQVIRQAQLQPEQVRVICSQHGDSPRKIAELGEGFEIGNTLDPVRKINFYTSTCFEGCDIYDPVGKTYIVSDAHAEHTLLDISTLFRQICGRIRRSVYQYDITHIYSTTRYTGITYDEFEATTQKALEEAERLVENFNRMDVSAQAVFVRNLYINELYLRRDDDRIVVDRNRVKIDRMNFRTCCQIYRNTLALTGALEAQGFQISAQSYVRMPPSKKLEMNVRAKVSFRELFEEYCTLKADTNAYSFNMFPIQTLEQANPLLREAYEGLGPQKVRELKYHVSNIRRALLKRMDTPTIDKVIRLSNQVFPVGQTIPRKRIKETLQRIYDDLGIRRTAKATDIADWYEVKEQTLRIKGKTVDCLTIVCPKFVRIRK